ncbi:hypothetical protein SDC9_157107 [bioreactor metagenome]|uniref:Uncharacterized protein n=1 Tax=bioreactor metagenome TaxID=1076179 RepID=A0A645F632_9ZZZZ
MSTWDSFLGLVRAFDKVQTTIRRPVIRYGREVAVRGKQKLKKQSNEAHFISILRTSNIHNVLPERVSAKSAADTDGGGQGFLPNLSIRIL